MAKGLAILTMLMLVMTPVSVMTGSLPLPPKAPWGLAYKLSDMQWVWRTRPVNMTFMISTTSQWVLLWLNLSSVMTLLGLDYNDYNDANDTSLNETWVWNMTIIVNGQPTTFNATGRYNMTFSQVLDLMREYHRDNMTYRRHVQVTFSMNTTETNIAQPVGENPWLKYWRAFVSAVATVMVGLKAGQDLKETRLKAKWRELLKAKAMDVDSILKSLESHGDEET